MRSSIFYSLIAFLLFVGLLISMCVLPPGYTYDETCPRCRGKGTVICETCHGSGECWVCGGDGVRDSLPPGMQWCPFCQGTGECYTCGGKG